MWAIIVIVSVVAHTVQLTTMYNYTLHIRRRVSYWTQSYDRWNNAKFCVQFGGRSSSNSTHIFLCRWWYVWVHMLYQVLLNNKDVVLWRALYSILESLFIDIAMRWIGAAMSMLPSRLQYSSVVKINVRRSLYYRYNWYTFRNYRWRWVYHSYSWLWRLSDHPLIDWTAYCDHNLFWSSKHRQPTWEWSSQYLETFAKTVITYHQILIMLPLLGVGNGSSRLVLEYRCSTSSCSFALSATRFQWGSNASWNGVIIEASGSGPFQ